MLKRFGVENFSSIDGLQVLDMTAGSTQIHNDHLVDFSGVRLLKSGVIYGANASGKSNLIKAVDFARKAIVEGLDNLDTYKKYFRLKQGNDNKPTQFEFEVEYEGRFFAFGFSVLLKQVTIVDEWLYEIGQGKPKLIFERKQQNITFGKVITTSKNRERFRFYAEDFHSKTSQLLLAELAQKTLNIAEANEINAVFDWFKNKLGVVYPEDRYVMSLTQLGNDSIDLLKHYLSNFDTGIVDIDVFEEDFEEALNDVSSQLKARISRDFMASQQSSAIVHINGAKKEMLNLIKCSDGNIKVRRLGFIHGHDKTETFELSEESDGTRRLMDFIPLLVKLSSGYTMLVDEFDRSLHPKLTREFINLFFQIPQSRSQLIVSTHESTLLDLELLRRDEIWFIEKTAQGSSTLFSLNQFKERYDKKIEKAYLLGRYGAIPVFGSFDHFDGDE